MIFLTVTNRTIRYLTLLGVVLMFETAFSTFGAVAASEMDQALAHCDTLASVPSAPDVTGPGVELNDIEVDAALTACVTALENPQVVPRAHFQLARALLASNNLIAAREQAELADAIEAYQLEVSGTTATKPVNEFFKGNERLEEILKGDGNYCKTGVGKIYGPVARRCGDFGDTKITKAEYDRLKDKKTDTASTTEPETASSGDDPLEAKLEKSQKLLEKGLLTEEEAAAKRAKLLEGL